MATCLRTHRHTIKPPTAGVQLVGHTSIMLIKRADTLPGMNIVGKTIINLRFACTSDKLKGKTATNSHNQLYLLVGVCNWVLKMNTKKTMAV